MNYRKSDIPEDLQRYFVRAEIGLEVTPDAFVAELVAVFREVRRVLRDDGVLFLNLGDSYYGSTQTGGNKGINASGGPEGFKQARQFKRPAVSRRADPCGTSGKEPADSPDRGCLCGSLCDACRKAYQTGKSHSDGPRAPMLPASLSGSSLGRRESPSDRLPTSDSTGLADRSLAAIPASAREQDHATALPLASLASTLPGSSSPLPAGSRQLGQPSECQLCGCSLLDFDPASARMAECKCDTSAPASASGTSDKDVSNLAWAHLTTPALKPKDLIGIPWRVAFALQADGWYLRQDIIWSKPNPMPESVQDRCTKAHEYLFLLSKSPTYFCDMAAIAEPVAPGNEGSTTGFYGARAGAMGRAASGNEARSIAEQPIRAETRNKRSVWTVTTQPFAEAHFATFPPALIEPCILAGCSENVCAKCGEPIYDERLRELRDVRSSDHDRSPRSAEALLQQVVCGQAYRQDTFDDQGLPDHESRLPSDLSARAPVGNEGRLRDGASARDGTLARPAAAEDRGRASQERTAPGQPAGEPGSDGEVGSRQAAEAASAPVGLPALRRADRHIGQGCARCGADLKAEGAIARGVVLDCFGGAGTTGLVADRLQRDAILIELNPAYADMARRRIHGDAPLFAEVA